MNELDPANPLESLMSRGIPLKLDDQQQLRVKTTQGMDDTTRGFLSANKPLIRMELAGLVVPCGECPRDVPIVYRPKIVTNESAGLWFFGSCPCGHEFYTCERDYWHWKIRNLGNGRRKPAQGPSRNN